MSPPVYTCHCRHTTLDHSKESPKPCLIFGCTCDHFERDKDVPPKREEDFWKKRQA